jgi:Zn-dependent alcohol dehydrogenase
LKAAVCCEFGKPLVVEEIEIDAPKAGEVRVKLAACAICHSDIHYMEGAWGGPLPTVFGHEAAGVVEETGPGVTLVEAGDHVVVTLIRSCGACFFCERGEPHHCEGSFALDSESRLHRPSGETLNQGLGTGAFAEYVVVDQSQVAAIPKEVPLDSAALLACGVITGLGSVVNTAKVPAGANVVVIGTGGVGLNSVQGAALSGAERIIALDIADDKLSAAKAFGATHALNSRTEDPRQAVFDLTGGRGADYVFVTVGSAAAMEQGLGLMRDAGTLTVVGMPALGVKMAVEAVNFAYAGQRILGSRMGSTRLQSQESQGAVRLVPYQAEQPAHLNVLDAEWQRIAAHVDARHTEAVQPEQILLSLG